MDVLDDWLRQLGAEGAVTALRRMPHEWGLQVPERDHVIFHVVAQGSCWVRCAHDRPIQLLQGEAIFFPQGISHELVHEPEAPAEPEAYLRGRLEHDEVEVRPTTLVSGSYQVDPHVARLLFTCLPPALPLTASQVRANPALFATLNVVSAELDSPGAGSKALLRHLIDALFVHVVREWIAELDTSRLGRLAALRDPMLVRALGHMHASPRAPWTVESLARSVGKSRAAFARRFTLHLGEPPLSYLTRWRMLLAAKELSHGEQLVAEVARKVGYDSEFAFSRAFKRHHGMPPARYRRGGNLPVVAPEPEIEMATVMGPDAGREYVSVFDASGIGAKPTRNSRPGWHLA